MNGSTCAGAYLAINEALTHVGRRPPSRHRGRRVLADLCVLVPLAPQPGPLVVCHIYRTIPLLVEPAAVRDGAPRRLVRRGHSLARARPPAPRFGAVLLLGDRFAVDADFVLRPGAPRHLALALLVHFGARLELPVPSGVGGRLEGGRRRCGGAEPRRRREEQGRGPGDRGRRTHRCYLSCVRMRSTRRSRGFDLRRRKLL